MATIQNLARLLIAGLPRSGTTLLATLLAAQRGIHFLTDYFPAFLEAQRRLHKTWRSSLNASERRIALALVRDQFLRVRHPVLVKLNAFSSIDELHRLVLAELVSGEDHWVGHKLLLSPPQLRATLEETDLHCLVLLRDPRDAALSFYHRTGGGIEAYANNWRDTARACRELQGHSRLLTLRFEDLVAEPEATFRRLGSWLQLELDPQMAQLRFQRSRAHGTTEWHENSAFQDVTARFDRKPIGRWTLQPESLIVRYAGWVTRRELASWNYAPADRYSAGEQLRFALLQALERGEHWAHESVHTAGRLIKRRLQMPQAI
ncbi:MAG TPA: sulfotransferase [Polyangiaceae bacterium]|nr:sulfotransferase [Polyangiaceae bacterium]